MQVELVKEHIKFIEKWLRHLFEREECTTKIVTLSMAQQYKQAKQKIILCILRALPYFCLAGFGVSLFYDFSGSLVLPWREVPISLEGLGRKLSVTGLVGFGTNWLAVKMLFYPRQKRPLLGQGLIPARKERIIMRLGSQIVSEIINSELIAKKIAQSHLLGKQRKRVIQNLRKLLTNQKFHNDSSKLLQQVLRELLLSKQFRKLLLNIIHSLNPNKMNIVEANLFKFFRLFANEKQLNKRLDYFANNTESLFKNYENNLRAYMEALLDKLELTSNDKELEKSVLRLIMLFIEQLNVQDVIMQNLQGFDELRLEKLLWNTTSDQLLYIQYVGCFLGILGGFFVWLPYESLLGFGTLLLGVGALDSLLLRWSHWERKRK